MSFGNWVIDGCLARPFDSDALGSPGQCGVVVDEHVDSLSAGPRRFRAEPHELPISFVSPLGQIKADPNSSGGRDNHDGDQSQQISQSTIDKHRRFPTHLREALSVPPSGILSRGGGVRNRESARRQVVLRLDRFVKFEEAAGGGK